MLAKRIIPCLDVKDGRVVKGVNFVGLRDAGDPVELAKFYSQEGADEIVFLDITATSDNRDTIADVVRRTCREVFVPVTVGGGIRTLETLERLADIGAARMVLGTALVNDPNLARAAVERVGGDRLTAGIDAKGGEVAVSGWIEGSGVAASDLARAMGAAGFKHIVYTDIARDGMQTGIDVSAYRHVAEVAGFPVVASGGISTLDDIRALAAVGEDAIEGAITGRALYEGNFTLAQALAAARGEE